MKNIEIKQSCTALAVFFLKFAALNLKDFNDGSQFFSKFHFFVILLITISLLLATICNMFMNLHNFNAFIDDFFYFIGTLLGIYFCLKTFRFSYTVFNFSFPQIFNNLIQSKIFSKISNNRHKYSRERKYSKLEPSIYL